MDLVSTTDCPRFVPENFKKWLRGPATNIICSSGARTLSKFPDRDTFVARFQKGGVVVGALYQYLHSLPAEPGPTGEPTFHKGAPPPERVASR